MASTYISLPVTASTITGPIDVNINPANDAIKISDGTDTLAVNTDGSINVQFSGTVTVAATDLDIRNLQFATDSVDVSGSNVTVSATNLDIRDLQFSTDKVDVSGSSVVVSATDLDVRNLQFATDSVDVSGSNVTVSATNLDVRDLQFASDKVDVSGSNVTVSASDLDIRSLEAFTGAQPDNVQLVGSIDGTKTGTKYGIVNNLRLQILDAHDRVAEFTYVDFGTKNQRIAQIDYTSSTFPGSTVRRVFTYTLVGNNYRRDDETWSIV